MSHSAPVEGHYACQVGRGALLRLGPLQYRTSEFLRITAQASHMGVSGRQKRLLVVRTGENLGRIVLLLGCIGRLYGGLGWCLWLWVTPCQSRVGSCTRALGSRAHRGRGDQAKLVAEQETKPLLRELQQLVGRAATVHH
jgi:hypothetical protein